MVNCDQTSRPSPWSTWNTRSRGAPTYYVSPGKSTQDFERDKFACENQLRIASAIGDPIDKLAYVSVSYADDLKRCMASRGWSNRFVILALAVSACATDYKATKIDTTNFYWDDRECGGEPSWSRPIVGSPMARRAFTRCMEGRGYTVTTRPER